LVQFKESLLVEVVLVGRLGAKNHSHASLKLLLRDAGLKTVQVKGVADEFFIELYHEFVALKRTEPLDPAHESGTTLIGELAFHFVLFLVRLGVVILLLGLLLGHHHQLLLLLHLSLFV
jgi:hypothetical protein